MLQLGALTNRIEMILRLNLFEKKSLSIPKLSLWSFCEVCKHVEYILPYKTFCALSVLLFSILEVIQAY